MEELKLRLEQIAEDNQSILNMKFIDYDFVNKVRKNMYNVALDYFYLKNKTILIKKLSWKNIPVEQVMQIIERGLIQLRYDLKSEIDVKLLKFISPD